MFSNSRKGVDPQELKQLNVTSQLADRATSNMDKKTVFCLFGSFIALVFSQMILLLLIYFNGDKSTAYVPLNILAKSSKATKFHSGKDWSLWDRKSVLPSSTVGMSCRWVDFNVPTISSQDTSISMCVHPQQDLISDEIIKTGFYQACAPLPHLWDESIVYDPEGGHGPNTESHASKRNSNLFYIDVGTNIGSCVLHMLLTTSAKIVAFEPNPDNLFCLTNTLMKLSPTLRSRVYLYPIGLGDRPSIQNIYGEHFNMGNSMVSKILDTQNSLIHDPTPIVIERLDQIMNLGSPDLSGPTPQHMHIQPLHVPLVKISAQGYECHILQGMKALLPHIHELVVRIEPRHMNEYECDARYIFDTLLNSGYKLFVFENNFGKEREIAIPEDKPRYDIIARSYKW